MADREEQTQMLGECTEPDLLLLDDLFLARNWGKYPGDNSMVSTILDQLMH